MTESQIAGLAPGGGHPWSESTWLTSSTAAVVLEPSTIVAVGRSFRRVKLFMPHLLSCKLAASLRPTKRKKEKKTDNKGPQGFPLPFSSSRDATHGTRSGPKRFLLTHLVYCCRNFQLQNPASTWLPNKLWVNSNLSTLNQFFSQGKNRPTVWFKAQRPVGDQSAQTPAGALPARQSLPERPDQLRRVLQAFLGRGVPAPHAAHVIAILVAVPTPTTPSRC